jgi:hypothetical protein
VVLAEPPLPPALVVDIDAPPSPVDPLDPPLVEVPVGVGVLESSMVQDAIPARRRLVSVAPWSERLTMGLNIFTSRKDR